MQLMSPVPSHHLQVIFVTLLSSALFLPILARTQGIAHYHSVLGETETGSGVRTQIGRHFYPGFYFYSLCHTSQGEAPFFLPFHLKPLYPSVLTAPRCKMVVSRTESGTQTHSHFPAVVSPQSAPAPRRGSEGCDVQTASSFCLFSSQDKEDGNLRMPA